jgi:hypothetical protein
MNAGQPLAFDEFPSEGTKARFGSKGNGAVVDSPITSCSPAAVTSRWPEPLTEAAFYGIAGDYVRLVEPASEADTAALLLQFLVAAGSVIGHKPYYLTEDTPHYVNFYTVLVGLSSKSRKGTSWGRVKRLFSTIAEDWGAECVSSGLSSGEGLIEAVRDPSGDGDDADTGVTDKRLLVCQGEFCSVLQSMERSGNTLSMVLRDAWDGENLRTMTRKNNALRATGAHISMIGHITRDELRAALTETDKANGFANRILWACIARSKELPDGGEIDWGRWSEMTSRVGAAVKFAAKVERIQRSADAKEIWRGVYHDLSASQPGMFGAVTSRSEAQVLRLSCLYALLDSSATVEAEHMQAGLAIWRYCEESARYIFGDSLGDPVADAIMAALKESSEGLTRTQLSDLFGRNKSAGRIGVAITALTERGLVGSRKEQTEGRSAEVWFAVASTKETK